MISYDIGPMSTDKLLRMSTDKLLRVLYDKDDSSTAHTFSFKLNETYPLPLALLQT